MRRLPGRGALPRPHLPRRGLLGVLLLAVLVVPGWFLVRDSPIASVDHVRISGLSGPQADAVRQAIETAARSESTLDLDRGKIARAAEQYPIVASVSVRARPLHTLDIAVRQHVPVAALANGSRRVAVASDGTILAGTLTHGLPLVPVGAPPGGRRLVERRALGMVALLGAAPRALLGRISGVELEPRGLVVHLTDGPDLYFGAARRLAAKWLAAARVLADYSSRGAAYVDVRVPERPAAGGLSAAGSDGTATDPGITTVDPAVTGTAPALPDPQPQVQAAQ